jgi:hypothetical protein
MSFWHFRYKSILSRIALEHGVWECVDILELEFWVYMGHWSFLHKWRGLYRTLFIRQMKMRNPANERWASVAR